MKIHESNRYTSNDSSNIVTLKGLVGLKSSDVTTTFAVAGLRLVCD